MRKIKFRAWDKTRNFMSYKILVGNTDTADKNYTAHCIWVDSEKVDHKRETGWVNFDELSDVVLMQWTGLKDKHGKEIYEGDVICYNGGKTESRRKMTVNWIDAGFVLAAYKEEWVYNLGECISDSLEVIGNIYENPELVDA